MLTSASVNFNVLPVSLVVNVNLSTVARAAVVVPTAIGFFNTAFTFARSSFVTLTVFLFPSYVFAASLVKSVFESTSKLADLLILAASNSTVNTLLSPILLAALTVTFLI